MNDDDAIAPEELLLRRIVRQPGQYDPALDPAVHRGAFTPNRQDVDGLSLFREAYISASAVALAARKPASDYVVARLRVSDVLSLGLSVLPCPDPGGLPGHVVIPELSLARYNDPLLKLGIKEASLHLARLASRDVILVFERLEGQSSG